MSTQEIKTIDLAQSVETPEKVSPSEGVRKGWAGLSYTTRVTLAFALIAAMTAVVSSVVVSYVWEGHFQNYTRENMEATATTTADRLAEVYVEVGGWSSEMTKAARYADLAFPDAGIAVVDRNGKTRYDSTMPIGGRLNGRDMGLSEGSLVPRDEKRFATAPIIANNEVVGSVRVFVFGSDTMLRQTDEVFKNNSYQALAIAGIIAIILASAIGYVFARKLVRPINRIATTAEEIKEGNLSARTKLEGEDEIARLGMTFDEMAESIERDRALERRLTTDVAHELRTPLMAIRSTVEAMIDGVFEADEERLETVNSEVQRLSRLVDALLKLSRLENRTTPIKKEVLDLGELTSSIISTHESFVTDSGLTLEYQTMEGVRVLGDADMIRQATANLISNAVRYTSEGGHITVRVKRGEIMGSIVVQDTGIGLTPEEAKMVFSRFWRADAGRNRESGGLGVGLSVVKEIVDRHGGWVQVEGKKGEGARFTIHLPLYNEAAANGKKADKTDKWNAPRNDKRKDNKRH